MRRTSIIILTALIVLTFGGGLSAQDETFSPEIISMETLPSQAYIPGLTHVWQNVNRCSSAALTIQLSYWRGGLNYYDTIAALNPHSEDMSVRLSEMIDYAETFGLKGIERNGGTLELLKLLIANGYPVLIENVYYDSTDVMRDWMSHNRVIVGYDDELAIFYSLDPLRGAGDDGQGVQLDYEYLAERWRPLLRNYMIIYEPENEAHLQSILGEQWDLTHNAEWTLEQVQMDLERPNTDSFDYFNLGSALVALERYEEAAEAFDDARSIGLPWRMLWYQFGPLEAYLQVGRIDDVFSLTRVTIADAPGVEEMYYYIARAYLAEGNTERAIANLEAGLWRNKNYVDAQTLLTELKG